MAGTTGGGAKHALLNAWAVGMLLASSPAWVLAQETYPALRTLSVPGRPEQIVEGDFTGDGLADLAVSAPQFGEISIHGGIPGGGFLGGSVIRVGGNPSALGADDFDGDGDLDLAWTDGLTGEVGVILLGSGNPPSRVILRQPGPDEPRALQLRDLDDDGFPEILVANAGADELGLYPNLQGDLGPGSAEPVGDHPDRLMLLRHPGGPTLAMRQSGRLSQDVRLIGLADGARQRIPAPGGGEIFVADLEGDGVDELFLADEIAAEIAVFSLGAGGWAESLRFPADSQVTGGAIAEVAPGDRRLAVGSRDRRRITVFGGLPFAPAPLAGWYAGGNLQDLHYGDLDGDGIIEIVFTQSRLNRMQFFPPLGDGLYAMPALSTPSDPTMIRRGSGPSGERLFAVPGAGDGRIGVFAIESGTVTSRADVDAVPGARAVRFAQLDAIAGDDLVCVSRTGGFRAFLCDGAGGYLPQPAWTPAGEIADLALADVVGGPALDLVFARLDPPALVVHEGLGGGAFASTPVAEVTTLEPLVAVRARDVDLDGRVDLVALGFDSLLTLFLNREGQPLAGVNLLVENAPRDVAFARLNKDPYPDMITINEGNSDFTVVSSVLPGVYTVAVRGEPTLTGASRLRVIDFDRDGADDFCVIASTTRSVGVHLNLGTAEEPLNRFSPPLQYELGEAMVDLDVLDFDGDLKPDLVGVDGPARVLIARASDPFGVLAGAVAAIQIDPSSPEIIRVLSNLEHAHDLRLVRLPGPVALPLEKVSTGVFEAHDPEGATGAVEYVVEDGGGTELDRLPLAGRGLTGAPGEEPFVLLPTEYEEGRAILRMRAQAGRSPRVVIYDLRGRRVAAPEVEERGADYVATWSGTDFRGRPVSRGRYLVRASLGPGSQTGSVHLR